MSANVVVLVTVAQIEWPHKVTPLGRRRLGAVCSKLSSGRQQFVRTVRARKPFSSGVVYWDTYFVKHITVGIVEGFTQNSTWLCTIASAVTLACGCSPDQSHRAFSWWILWPTSEWKDKGDILTQYLYSPHLWCLCHHCTATLCVISSTQS